MTEREHNSAVLLLLKNMQEQQVATRNDVHELREDLQKQNLSAALDRQKVSIRLDVLESKRQSTPCNGCSVGTAAVAVQKRTKKEQAGLVSVGVVSLALVVKLVEVVGSEVVQHLGKLASSR